MGNTTTKEGTLIVVKENGIIKDVKSDFHLDELFKTIHFLRSKLNDSHPDKDILNAMEKMGWPITRGKPDK